MKIFLLCLLMIISSAGLNAQAAFTKLLEVKYSDLPAPVRIENSGIYSVSSFDVEKNNVWLNEFDRPVSLCYSDNQLQKTVTHEEPANDYIISVSGLKKIQQQYSSYNVKNGYLKLKKLFIAGHETVFTDDGGSLTGDSKDRITLNVRSREELVINYETTGFNRTLKLNFPSTLAYSELIGIDSLCNSFILAETYISEVPLKIQREVYTVSANGAILSVLQVPSVKYLYTTRDFQVDSEGNLYEMISDKEKITILKWTGLTDYSPDKILCPQEFNYELHFNNVVPVLEAKGQTLQKESHTDAATRTAAVRTAESYVLHKYTCQAKNLSPVNVTAPDGDIVRTPSWLGTGVNAKIPYMWGGYSTLAQFDDGLRNGKYAGDINTSGVTSYSVGVDCSGFVSRCWAIGHYSTSGMPAITTQYSSWDGLKPGDAILKQGHVRLFVDKTSSGALRVIESSARDWGVSFWSYTPSDLTLYSPCYLTGMVNDYSMNQPIISSALKQPDGTVRLSWSCDTTLVKGYRLYKSSGAESWSLIKDETALKSTIANITMSAPAEYYRVSSVMNSAPSYSESNWSNALGAGKFTATAKKILIIDGFDRISGSWRGNGHTFAVRYGKALEALSVNFETIRNSQLSDPAINLQNYDAVYWIQGDEGTLNESFSSDEQALVKSYLESGGSLFVSGSEIGYDLSASGSAEDKSFYNNYLKASFLSDNAIAGYASGINGAALSETELRFGQTYEEDSPDEISPYGGSTLCMNYANNKGAGVQYKGPFGQSSAAGKLIYISFPVETIADDAVFNSIISKSSVYFFGPLSLVADNGITPLKYSLFQNYPNPFNPSTAISYELPANSFVTIKIYDPSGREAITLVNTEQSAGSHTVYWNGKDTKGHELSSGIYLYRITAGHYTETRKMNLLR